MTVIPVARIAGFEIVTPDIDRLARFYVRALGCTREGARLRLGLQSIRLLPAEPGALAYPQGSTAADLWFQHFAIVTTDIGAAAAQAQGAGAVPITQGGPQQLPPEAGGVSAWKFRDPDGHPLELLQFSPDAVPAPWGAPPRALHLGIDHTAISVADVDATIAYYRDRFGFSAISRQTNHGAAQSRLDALPEARAEVVALRPPGVATPHLELLGYEPAGRRSSVTQGDVAATRVVLETGPDVLPGMEGDPDGHLARWRPAA